MPVFLCTQWSFVTGVPKKTLIKTAFRRHWESHVSSPNPSNTPLGVTGEGGPSPCHTKCKVIPNPTEKTPLQGDDRKTSVQPGALPPYLLPSDPPCWKGRGPAIRLHFKKNCFFDLKKLLIAVPSGQIVSIYSSNRQPELFGPLRLTGKNQWSLVVTRGRKNK